MLFSEIKTGKDWNNYISEMFSSEYSINPWALPRTHTRNELFLINKIVVIGKLTNSAMGFAMSKNANLIFLVQPISHHELINKWHNIIELIYKNDIFIYSLNQDWFLYEIVGMSFVNKLFGGDCTSIWHEQIKVSHLYLSFNKFSRLRSILSRFQCPLIWSRSNKYSDLDNVVIETLLLINQDFNYSQLKLLPDALITTNLSSTLIEFCWENNIVLIWLHLNEVLNEIAREFVNFLQQKSTGFEILLHQLNMRNFIKK